MHLATGWPHRATAVALCFSSFATVAARAGAVHDGHASHVDGADGDWVKHIAWHLAGAHGGDHDANESAAHYAVEASGGLPVAMWVYVVLAAALVTVLGWKVVVICRVPVAWGRAGAAEWEGGRAKWSIPLGVANMLLSLGILLVATVIVFALSNAAGRHATEASVDDCHAAAAHAYQAAIHNVAGVALTLRSTLLDHAGAEITARLTAGRALAAGVAGVYRALDTHAWADFDRLAPLLTDIVDGAAWTARVDTVDGYFAAPFAKTDDRDDATRGDGVDGSVHVTRDGGLYGYVTTREVPLAADGGWGLVVAGSHPATWDLVPYKQVAGQTRGDPLDVVNDLDLRFGARVLGIAAVRHPVAQVRSANATSPAGEEAYALTLFTPLYSRRTAALMGVGTLKLPLAVLRDILRDVVGRTPATANATLVVYERTTQRVCVSTRAAARRVAATPAFAQTAANGYDELFTLADVPAVELNMLAAMLGDPDAASPVEWDVATSGDHDDRDADDDAAAFHTLSARANLRQHLPDRRADAHTRFALAADQSSLGAAAPPRRLRDATGHRWDAGFDDGDRGWSYARDTHAQGRVVVRLTGAPAAAMKLYREITLDAPELASTDANGTSATAMAIARNGRAVAAHDDGAGNPLACPTLAPGHSSCLRRGRAIGSANGQPHTLTIAVKPDVAMGPFGYGGDGSDGDAAPQLFTGATEEGVGGADAAAAAAAADGLLRIFADGRVVVDAAAPPGSAAPRVACDLPPLALGTPAGVWTVFSVVVDGLARQCAVYVNGTLHVAMAMRQEAVPAAVFVTPTQPTGPHLIGRHFAGAVDHLMLHDLPLTAAEAAELHANVLHGGSAGAAGDVEDADATHTLHQDGDDAPLEFHSLRVPDRLWYVDVRRGAWVDAGVHGVTQQRVPARPTGTSAHGEVSGGLGWDIAILVPVRDVLRRVHLTNEDLLAGIQAREVATNAKLRQNTQITVVVVLMIVLASAVVFLMCNEAMTGPFARITQVLVDVSLFKIDKQIEVDASHITEVRLAQCALVSMTDTLRELRSYLPQSVFASMQYGHARRGGRVFDTAPSDDEDDEAAVNIRCAPTTPRANLAPLPDYGRLTSPVSSDGAGSSRTDRQQQQLRAASAQRGSLFCGGPSGPTTPKAAKPRTATPPSMRGDGGVVVLDADPRDDDTDDAFNHDSASAVGQRVHAAATGGVFVTTLVKSPPSPVMAGMDGVGYGQANANANTHTSFGSAAARVGHAHYHPNPVASPLQRQRQRAAATERITVSPPQAEVDIATTATVTTTLSGSEAPMLHDTASSGVLQAPGGTTRSNGSSHPSAHAHGAAAAAGTAAGGGGSGFLSVTPQPQMQRVGSSNSNLSTASSSRRHRAATVAVPRDPSGAAAPQLPLHVNLARTRFSLYMMNIRGFHDLLKPLQERQVLSLVEQVLTTVAAATSRHHGILENFSGDRYLASYNASRGVANHAAAAASTALAVTNELCDDASNIRAVCSAVVTGKGLIGNVGTRDMRRFTFLSPVFSYGAALLQLASSLNAFVLAAHDTRQRLDDTFVHRLLAGVRFNQLSHVPAPVYELYARTVPAAAVADGSPPPPAGSWLLEPADDDDDSTAARKHGAALDGIAAWNNWAAAVMSQDWPAAAIYATAAAAHDHESVAYELLEDAHNTKCYEPIDLGVPYVMRCTRRFSTGSW